LADYTVQEAYDGIIKWFSKPGRGLGYFTDDAGVVVCEYRTNDGARCAVGCLVSDEEYESTGWMIDNLTVADSALYMRLDLCGFLIDAQSIHDFAAAHDTGVDQVSAFLTRMKIAFPDLEENRRAS